jgi:hypothetical protein
LETYFAQQHHITALISGQTAAFAIERYEKQVPGHHVQVDVKFLDKLTLEGKKLRRFQYTAIDVKRVGELLQLPPASRFPSRQDALRGFREKMQ